MSNVIRIAIVDPSDPSRESLKNMLLGMEAMWLEAECSRYEFFIDVVGQTNPDVGIISISDDPDKALDLIAELSKSAPNCGLLVLSNLTDGQIILKAMRAGAKEYLTQPVNVEERVAAVERMCHTSGAGSDGRKKSRSSQVVAICGATGGVGCTSLAVNLGCALAADSANSVVLADLDVALGDADVYLDTIPEYTLADVAQNIARLDFSLLKQSLTKHSSGLYLLPRPVQLQDTSDIHGDDLHRVFGLLRATFSHLIIDTSKTYSELDLVALEDATHILLVTQLDLPCLRNVVRLLSSFEDIAGVSEKVKVVINRFGLDSSISQKKAEETIGREIYWKLPNDFKAMVEVRNNGVPLLEQAPRAAVTQSINGLARKLCGISDEGAANSGEAKHGRWLNFWPPSKAGK